MTNFENDYRGEAQIAEYGYMVLVIASRVALVALAVYYVVVPLISRVAGILENATR